MAAYLVVSVEEIIDPDLLNEYGQRTGLPPLSGPTSMREFDAVLCPTVQAGA